MLKILCLFILNVSFMSLVYGFHYNHNLMMSTSQPPPSPAKKGFGSSIPKPKIITPSQGKVNPQLDKFLMMYTCKKCTGRNAQMVSKVAYQEGMVVSTCTHCKVKHLIADNKGLLDLPEYGKKISEYLEQKGETVQRLSITDKDLENNYLVDDDGMISMVSKAGGQLSPDVTIVEYPSNKNNSDK